MTDKDKDERLVDAIHSMAGRIRHLVVLYTDYISVRYCQAALSPASSSYWKKYKAPKLLEGFASSPRI